MKKLSLILVLIFPLTVLAQREQWKSMRYEFQLGAGTSNFLGELGGAPQIGTHALRDLNWKTTRPSTTLGMRYRIGEYFALKGNISIAWVHGEDTLTQEYYRHYRNLDFRSGIQELSLVIEGAFMKEQMGRAYRIREFKGKRGREIYNYGFIGIGLFHFNPKGHDKSLGWIPLRPLHTEGEGLIHSRKQYSLYSVCIPVGVGFKYTIKKKWSIGLDYGIRYTFTDYIDDVSTTYVDPKLLLAERKGNPIAANMADKSNKSEPITGAGAQRGNPRYNDAYIFAIVTVNYKLKSDRNNLPKF